jgi:hypothetical protein
MKVIIKRPCDQFGEETTIPNTLRALQETVGGYIETVTLDNGVVLICNEEGKLRDMPYNFTLRIPPRVTMFEAINELFGQCKFFGTVIACGVEGDEFADIPIDFNEWKSLLCEWGN